MQGRCRAAAVAVFSLAIGVHKRCQANALDGVAASTFLAATGFHDTLLIALKARVGVREILGRAYYYP